MAKKTGIEWADATWNPWMGCEKVSPACAHCYAEREMKRYGRDFNAVTRAKDSSFSAPMKWKEPRRIFTCSWSDFFIEEADDWRAEAFNVIVATPRHTYMILTKRPERIPRNVLRPMYKPLADDTRFDMPANVWLGVSVENARYYRRIETIQQIPATVRFLSVEPLLGRMQNLPLDGIGWVIVGGESGANFRPLNLDWVREIRDQCVKREVPFFFKQKSGFFPKAQDRLLDGLEWNQIP